MTLPARFPASHQLPAAQTAASQLAAALADPPPPPGPDTGWGPRSPRWVGQSLAKGAAGIAVLHGALAKAGLTGWDTACDWLACAARENLSAGPGAGLWYGAPAVAFAITTSAPVGTCARVIQRLDATVDLLANKRLKAACTRMDTSACPPLAEFDLVRGLAGLGAYLLRRDPGGETTRHVLSYLVRLTEPLPPTRNHPAVPGWWTSDMPNSHPAGQFHGGHADLGMAHGISGPLALLALAARRGITVSGHFEAIDRICRWLDTCRHDVPTGPWWPQRVNLAGEPSQHGPGRPSWCYGTPGIARAQQLAGIALADPARRQLAEHALAACLSDPAQTTLIRDNSVCHGWAGLAATAFHAAADAADPALSVHLNRLLATLLRQAATAQDPKRPGLIEGTAGLALSLHTMTRPRGSDWESCLLII